MSAPVIDLQPLTLPLRGLRLIEASAGTGKTWTIAALYVRLVLGHEPDAADAAMTDGDWRESAEALSSRAFMPPEILVLTFTEAAARELRDRIRHRLVEAAAAFRQGVGTDAFLTDLLTAYGEEGMRVRAAFRLEQAAQWLDEAAISTIHAWCLRVLQQHAFDSGSLFSQELVQDLAPLREEAVRDVWRRRFYPLADEDAALVAELLGSPQALGEQLAPLLAAPGLTLCRDGRPAPADSAAAWRQLHASGSEVEAARARVWQGWREQGGEAMALVLGALADKRLKAVSYKPAWLQGFPTRMADWLAGGDMPTKLPLFASDRLSANAAKGKAAPEHPWFDAVATLVEADSQAALAREELRMALLAELRAQVHDELESQLRQQARLGFDDLLRRVDAALAGDDGARLRARLRERYPVALIDEFQDTDPVQFRIFERLYHQPAGRAAAGAAHVAAHCLLLIGDPKQAIYSFRGADLPTYLHARALAETPHHTLGRNFRSSAALVAGVNALFTHAEQRWPGGAFAQSSADPAQRLSFQPVRAQGRRETLVTRQAGAGLQPLPAMQLALPESAQPLAKGAARGLLAEACAATILAWLQAAARGELGFADLAADPEAAQLRALTAGDIAVLVRNRHEAAAMRRALGARGIPSVYGSDRDSVYASAEAGQLQCWLEACERPSDEARLRLALATPALGRSWADLDRLRHDERGWEDEVERLRGIRDIWQRQGVLAALRAWLFVHDVPARLLHPDCADGERALTNFLHLAELLEQAAVGLQGEHALIRHLAECRETAGQGGADEAILRLESDSARVRVVTLHQSKGLEYPVACLPFTALPASPPSRGPLRYHVADGQSVLDLDNRKGSVAREQACVEQLQEDLRLFYVGLTRPQSLLWMALMPVWQGNERKTVAQQTPWAQILAGAGQVATEAYAAALAELLKAVPELVPVTLTPAPEARWTEVGGSGELLPALDFPGLPVRPWWVASYSALRFTEVAHARGAAGSLEDVESAGAERFSEQALLDLSGLPRGAEIGTFWHDILEWAAERGFAACARDIAGIEAEVEQRCRLRGWDEQAPALKQGLRHWLAAPMPLPGASTPASLAELDSYQAELEFWLAAGGCDARDLDALVTAQVLPGQARAALEPLQLRGLFKGFMDLVFEHEGRYYVADYKSNHLGEDPAAYAPQALADAVLAHRYDLQYCLYLLALHRLLRLRLPDYDYDRHVGGAVYLFLRGWDGQGRGVHVDRPSRALIEAMDRLFAEPPAAAGRWA